MEVGLLGRVRVNAAVESVVRHNGPVVIPLSGGPLGSHGDNAPTAARRTQHLALVPPVLSHSGDRGRQRSLGGLNDANLVVLSGRRRHENAPNARPEDNVATVRLRASSSSDPRVE